MRPREGRVLLGSVRSVESPESRASRTDVPITQQMWGRRSSQGIHGPYSPRVLSGPCRGPHSGSRRNKGIRASWLIVDGSCGAPWARSSAPSWGGSFL